MRAAACALLGLLLVAGLPAVARAAAVATTVAVIDSDGAPLAGAQITYYGSSGSWQPVQVTGADGAVHLNLTAGSYTFKATSNGGSLQQTRTVDASHTSVTFQTLDVNVAVVNSQGAGIAGVVQNFYGSTGSWVGNRTTSASGELHYELLAGSYHFQATSNGGSQQQALAVDPAHTSLTFTTLDVSVALLDSQDAGIAGGVQNFYGSTGSWVGNRTTAAGGVLHYELLAGSYTFQTTYSGGSQRLPLVVSAAAGGEAVSLAFHTLAVRVSVVDSHGTGIAGAIVNFYGSTGSWVGNRTTAASGLQRSELLPGTYHFQATLNGGSQQQVLAVDDTHTELAFTTLDTPVAVLDSTGDAIAGAVVNHYGSTGSWIGNRTTGAIGPLHYELLPGSYRFQATHSGGRQQLSLAVTPTSHDLTFQTLDVVVAVRTSQNAGIAGAVVNFYGSTGSWVGNRTTDGTGRLHYELLTGSYTFQATTKGGSQQQQIVAAPGSTALAFDTAPVTALVVDASGAPVAGASINHYGSTGSWVGSRQTDSSGQVVTELLPGTYTFQSTRWGTMTRSLTVPPSTLITFQPGGPTTRSAPPSPTGVAAAAAITAAPALRWDAVPGAVSYRVYRGAALAGTTTGTTFVDRTAPDETFGYSVVAVDAGGVASAPGVTVTITVDTIAPVTHVTTAPAAIAGSSLAIEFAADPDTVATACSVDGGLFTACTSPWQVDDLAEGGHTLAIRSTDAAGNVETPPVGVTITVDTTPPAPPTLTATPATDLPLGSGRGTVVIGARAASDAARVRVRREGDVIYDGAAPANLTDDGLDDGTTYHYRAVAYDAAGNASIAATASAETPDRTAPAAPAAPEGSGYPLHVTWRDDSGTTFTLQRDGTTIAHTSQAAVTDADAVDDGSPDAPGGVSVTDLTRSGLTIHWAAPADHGTRYRYTVHGEDTAGNVGPDSAAGELVARSGVAEYVVLVNGVATGSRTTGTSLELAGLPAGVKRTITVVAVDGAGNGSDPSVAVEVGKDEAPDVPADLAATTPTRGKPELTWPAVAGATGYIVLRDGDELARVTGLEFTDQDLDEDGTYFYTVAAIGAAGIPSDPSEPFEVEYDTTAPETMITAGPAAGARVRDAIAFDLGPDETNITFACALDDAAAAPCRSPWALTGLASGDHHVAIAATDAVGNVDATPVTRAFTVDLTVPGAPSLTAVADTSLPAGSGRGRAAVTATPGEAGTRVVVTEGARLILDGAGGSVADDVPDGVELSYRAVSYGEAGNVSDATTVTIRTPDRTAPATPQITSANGYPLTLRWTMEAGATATVRRGATTVARTGALRTEDRDALDTAAPAVPDGVVATNVTTDGFDVSWAAAPDAGTEYRYTATARDDAGNVSPPTPPTPATATSGTAGYLVLVDGAANARTDATHAHVDGLAAGSTHAISVVAVDGAGNASARSAALNVPTATRAGTPPPAAKILGEPVITRPNVPVRLKADVTPGTAPVASVTWRFTDGTTATGSEVERAFKTTGSQLVRVSATDAGGGVATGSMIVVVDGAAPRATIDGRTPNGVVVVGSDDLSGVASMTARWPGGSATAKGARLVLKLPANVTAVDVTAHDRAGNVGKVSLRVLTDRVRPSLTVTGPALAFGPRATIRLSAPGARLLVDGRKARGTVRVAAGRKHVVESVDKAGNRSRVAILIPRDRPIAKLKSPALDGPRGDELWPGQRDESGVRRYLLRAAQQRLVIAGALPAKFRLTTSFTADVAAAVRTFQAANGIAASGKIDARTKAALDRVATGTRLTWSGK